MPEGKNSFLGGKMNTDLDDRLLDNKDYRRGLNVNVVNTEGSNSGVAKNIQGNTNKTLLALGSIYKVIGYYADNRNARIYRFITDDTNHSIRLYDKDADSETTIVSGSFLNFDKSYLITGINLIEDTLAWTDNNNQPRAIDVEEAISDNTFYDSEEKISVARRAPVYAPKITAAVNDTTISSDFIKEEFARFAYRYKFKNKQYSLFSPFTSTAFKMDDNEISSEEDIYSSTEIDIMVNGVNKITMSLPVPSATPITTNNIEYVDVLMKLAGSSAVYVVETIDLSTVSVANIDANNDGTSDQPSVSYTYSSTRPKYTLPERDLIRVTDKTPVKALAQETVSNRLLYGNIITGYDAPDVDYLVSYSPKSNIITTNNPILANQTIKQRRRLQVGLVLSDLYGRSTPVLLSSNSTIYIDAKDNSFVNSTWDGDSLKVIFPTAIPNAYNASTNPLGWYSFKIVVKQVEQEYYNVYTGGAINKGSSLKRSWIQLFGDNVNKVPRDETNSNNNDEVISSSVRLYEKVVYDGSEYLQLNEDIIEVIGIGTEDDFNTNDAFYSMYESLTKPLLALVASDISVSSTFFSPTLAVYETEPFESSIDIYYETATSGFVSQINDNINDVSLDDISISDSSVLTVIPNVAESTTTGSFIATLYAFDNAVTFDQLEPGTVTWTLNSGGTVNSIERYVIVQDQDGQYKIKLNRSFVYDSLDTSRTLNITASFAGTDITKNFTFSETDIDPIITGPTTANLDPAITPATQVGGGAVSGGVVAKVYATNGSSLNPNNKTDLTFSIVSATHNAVDVSSNFGINSDWSEDVAENGTGTLYVSSSISGLSAANDVNFVLRAADSNGDTTGNDLSLTVDLVAGGGYDSLSLYFASWGTFSSTSDACSAAHTDPRWSAVTVYVPTGENPIVSLDTNEKIYADTGLTTGADSGWYRDVSNSSGKWQKSSPGIWVELSGCTA